jgi:nicotinamide N-methyltransferase/methyltransferase
MTDSSSSSSYQLNDYQNKFDAKNYLASYYSEVTPNYVFYIHGLVHSMKKHADLHRSGGKALDFGGGPSLWPSFLLAQYVDAIQVCDYTEANLQAVQAWLDRSSNAHDWTTFFRYVLQAHQTSENELSNWENRLRRVLTGFPLSRCDANDPNCPILSGPSNEYDIIVSCECLDVACQTIDAYKNAVRRLVRLLKPGGFLVLLAAIDCSYYMVGNERFTGLPLNEQLIREALQEAGINPDQINIESEKIGDKDDLLADYYGGIIVTAVKSNESK